MCGGFIVTGGAAAIAADGQIAEGDVDAVGIDLRAGVADGGDEASPVRIAAGPRGFYQRGMGDGFGDAQGVGIAGGAVDAQFDNMGDTFAVGDDLPRERSADLGERGGEVRIAGADGGAAGAGSEQQHGVVGGGVAVDGDAIEADFDGCVADKCRSAAGSMAASVRM